MNSLRKFKQKLLAISRLRKEKKYDEALAALLTVWPGNPHLHVLWARQVQLQEDPEYDRDRASTCHREHNGTQGCVPYGIAARSS